jgi:hypothetical protein
VGTTNQTLPATWQSFRRWLGTPPEIYRYICGGGVVVVVVVLELELLCGAGVVVVVVLEVELLSGAGVVFVVVLSVVCVVF